MRSGTSWPATSPTASCRAPRARLATSRPPPGSSRRSRTGSRIWPTCSPTTTRRPSSSPAPPGRDGAGGDSSRRRRCASWAWPAERALGLDTAAALASSEHALALAPAGHPDRAAALARFAEAAFHVGRLAEAAEALEEAIASFRERGDLLAAARAMGTLAEVLYRTGEPRWAELPGRGRGPARAAASWPRARQRAHRPRSRRGRSRARPRPASAMPSRRSRSPASSACRGRRAPSATSALRAATSATWRGSRTSGKRSLLPPRPGRAAMPV